MSKSIVSAVMGNCVHVAGLAHFNQIAEQEGFEIFFMGAAVPSDSIIKCIKEQKPGMVALSYRLTPDNAKMILEAFIDRVRQDEELKNIKWLFGGTRPVAAVAADFNFFDYISDSMDGAEDIVCYLRNQTKKDILKGSRSDKVIDRIKEKAPFPLLRHHYGEPTLEATVKGIQEIAKSGCLDIISVGPDQNTQQYFFNQEEMDRSFEGAGGVPLRSAEDFVALKNASLFGNHPLLRCYSGTENVLLFADMILSTINKAWCAVPLCWYNEMDGRGTRSIEVSIAEAQLLMKWHGERDIPVEVNEPHHWGLRDAHDTMSVIMAYLSAYNAKAAGVKDYIAQYMFNVPGSLSFSADLAKTLAMIELAESLRDEGFRIYRQTRAGLAFLSANIDMAKGQLAASTYLQMAVSPHIIHVVGYSEAEEIATPKVVIESCKIVKGVIQSVISDSSNCTDEEKVLKRKEHLISEAKYTIDFIKNKYGAYKDPLTNAEAIADCIKEGVIDAPHILKGGKFKGTLYTKIQNGQSVAFSKKLSREISEEERLSELFNKERMDG